MTGKPAGKKLLLGMMLYLMLCFFFPSEGKGIWYSSWGGETGWWWYKEAVKKEKVKKVEKEKQQIKEVKKTNKEEWKPEKSLEKYTYEELLTMPVDEFRKLLNYYRDLAVSNPTEKNVYYYYNLVDVARKKALLFMAQTMNVMHKYPALYVGKDVPVINPGIKKEFALKRQEERKYASQIGDEFGLVLFIKPGCPYCEVQKEIMRYFLSKGIPVKIVNIMEHPEAVTKFAIEEVPTIILVYKETGNYLPVAVGVTSINELERQIATAAGYLKGEKEIGSSWLYDFQKGTTLDPYTPPPLWRKEKKEVKER